VPKVLIIDANERHSHLLSTQLTGHGFEVSVANRAVQGVELAIQGSPDLILMDGFMPDQTGFQMCNQLRRHKATQSIPIVMMSGIAHYANQQAFALERGATAYLTKSRVTIEVGEIVDKYLSWKPGKQPAKAPPPQKSFSASTDIHKALSNHLHQALDDNKNG